MFKNSILFHKCSDWMSFAVTVKLPEGDNSTGEEVRYIGDPHLGAFDWNVGVLRRRPGAHMICDLNGKGLKWDDVEDGMEVKIKSKAVNPDYPTYEFLYSSEGKMGKHFICYKRAKYKTIYFYISFTYSFF